MTSSEQTPKEQSPLDALLKVAITSDACLLISFKQEKDDEGKDVITPSVNMHQMGAGSILSAHTIMHNLVKQRLEYVMMDYVRLLKEEASAKKKFDDMVAAVDGATSDGGSAGDSSGDRVPLESSDGGVSGSEVSRGNPDGGDDGVAPLHDGDGHDGDSDGGEQPNDPDPGPR